ncbi:MAG: type III pantothenate kinase [Eubacteriales bacterium]
MLFVIDVGNTNIVAGFYEGDKLKSSYRMATDKNKSSDEIGLFFSQLLNHEGISKEEIRDVIISSVVPSIMHALENAIKKYVGISPIVVNGSLDLGLNICYDDPKEVGADRIVNAVAVDKIYGGPAVIIDFGTATTFCVIDGCSNYLGGVIYPGLKISMDALVEKTSKLPRIEIIRPENVVGKNTVCSMQSGLVFGYAGMVDAIVSRIKKEIGTPEMLVIATGGLSTLIAKESETIQTIDKNLTIKGLKIIYDRIKLAK